MTSMGDKNLYEAVDEKIGIKDGIIKDKKLSIDGSRPGSLPAIDFGGSDLLAPKNSVFGSIKVVIFSAKINLLMPFGPLAILIDRVYGNHVSCPLFVVFSFA